MLVNERDNSMSLRYCVFEVPEVYQLSPINSITSGANRDSFLNVFRGTQELLRSLLAIEEWSYIVA